MISTVGLIGNCPRMGPLHGKLRGAGYNVNAISETSAPGNVTQVSDRLR